MLSHRWERKELGLHDIQDKVIYDLGPVGTVVKLQKFCEVARDAGHRWAWSDTCCIDQNNNIEVQQSVNSMFVWYHYSALTIVYLSDVPPSSKLGALANSVWNTRGWTVQEFLAPKIVLFYQADWTLYIDNHSRNHKESVVIMGELEDSTGINARALVDCPRETPMGIKACHYVAGRHRVFAVRDLWRPPSCNLRRKKTERARTSLAGDHCSFGRHHSPRLGGTIVQLQQLSPSRDFLIQGSAIHTTISI
jgi:hypothetical protein